MSVGGELGEVVSVLGRFWEDPAMTGLGRLPASTWAGRAPVAGDRYTHDLRGTWSFRLLDRPVDAPAGWTTMPLPGGVPVAVPGCWTTQGFWDKPQYTNVVMPFAGDPPSVPDPNPTGLYRTTFRRPVGWAGRRTILHIGGAESCAAVWCNGAFVGVSTDSRVPSEFEVTRHVRSGVNELAVMVVKWSAGTWMEDQDHWHHGGLHRRVYLRSIPDVNLADVRLTAGLEPGGLGTLSIEARVDWGARLGEPPAGWTVRARVAGFRRRAQAAAPVSVLDTSTHPHEHVDAYRHPGPSAVVTLELPDVCPWSHERPDRYDATVELVDPAGEVVHTYTSKVGFRSVEVRRAELLLNGAPLLIAGVNRHDHHPVTGKSSTDEQLREDVLNIKRCGFNAVRTAHYPPDPAVLDACDEVGLWVVLEANAEAHARINSLAHDPRFEAQYVERVQRAVRTHWNHPSIMGWSLGNEAGYGAVHDAAAAWVRRTDPSRFVQYEGAVMGRWRDNTFVKRWSSPATDIECPMYAYLPRLIEWARHDPDKPLILCEYQHAMGNSNGALADYWEAFEQYHGLQGGFIWDWKDQAFALTAGDGTPYWGYGGCFGENRHDSTFCINGIVGADGVPHPAIEEHRWLTRPVRTTFESGALRITNRRSFTGTADLVGTATVAVDGEVVLERALPTLDLPPGATRRVPFKLPVRRPAGELAVTVRWAERRATAWAPKGHVVAWDQHVESPGRPDDARSRPRQGGRSEPEPVSILPHADGREGGVGALRVGGNVLLERLPVLNLWRAPIDNDGVLVGPFAGMADPSRRWVAWGLDRMTAEPAEVRRRGSRWTLTTRWTTGAGHVVEHVQDVAPLPGGGVAFVETVRIPAELDDLPRVGVRFALAPSIDRLRWYGRGPWETMPDRAAAPIGVWSSTIAEQWVPYVWPQHHGSHVDTRWFELTDRRGRGVRATLGGLTFDASQYSIEQLTEARTHAELVPSGRTHVSIDAALRGAGTGACGPDSNVIVRGRRYSFRYRIEPL